MEVARPVVEPIAFLTSLKEQTYEALKRAIMSMNIYESWKRLSWTNDISRRVSVSVVHRCARPWRGLSRKAGSDNPRRGVFVVRKTKQEIIEIVTAWAALESMAARPATSVATGR